MPAYTAGLFVFLLPCGIPSAWALGDAASGAGSGAGSWWRRRAVHAGCGARGENVRHLHRSVVFKPSPEDTVLLTLRQRDADVREKHPWVASCAHPPGPRLKCRCVS